MRFSWRRQPAARASRPWRELGFTETESELWEAAGYEPVEAAAWRDSGVDGPSEADAWDLVGVDASAAAELRALGYDPTGVPAIEGLPGLMTAA